MARTTPHLCILTLILMACGPTTPPSSVSTFAGSGTGGTADGQGAAAQFNNPVNVVTDEKGNLYIADFYDNEPGRIRKITPSGLVSTYPVINTFIRPFGLAYHSGILYITTDKTTTNTNPSSLWKLEVSKNVAPALVKDGLIDGGRNRGMVAVSSTQLVVSDRVHHTLSTINLSGETPVVTALAGMSDTSGTADGTGDQARFNTPYGLALLNTDVIVADSANHCIRKVKLTGEVSTVAGTCGTAGFKDAIGTQALFNNPQDVATDSKGNIYVTDNQNQRIRKISINQMVTTIAGSGNKGFKDGPALDALFFAQEGIEVSADGRSLFIADGNGGNESEPFRRIRQMPLP